MSSGSGEQTGDGWNYTGVGFICVCAQVKRCWPFVLVVFVEIAGVGGLALLLLDVASAKMASCAVLRPPRPWWKLWSKEERGPELPAIVADLRGTPTR